MDELEEFNRPVRNHYYDKLDWEEDESSIDIPQNIHKKYEEIEMVFDRICGYDVKIAEKESLNDRKCFDKINNQGIGSPNDFVYGEIVSITTLTKDFSCIFLCYKPYNLQDENKYKSWNFI